MAASPGAAARASAPPTQPREQTHAPPLRRTVRDGHLPGAVRAHAPLPGGALPRPGLPDPDAFAAAPRPLDVDLRFSDGVLVAARLLTEPGEGSPLVLAVPAHTTAAGTRIDARAWRIRGLVVREGADVELVVGALPRS